MSKLSEIRAGFVKIMLAGTVAVSLLVTSQAVQAATISDINKSADYARASIIALAEQNIISGDANFNFNPYRPITRAEMVKVLVNVAGIPLKDTYDTQTFTDVPKTHWAHKYVEAAYEAGIVKGVTNDKFGITGVLTREAMGTMFVRALGLNDSVLLEQQSFDRLNEFADNGKVSAWAKASVDFAVSVELLKGTGENFNPSGSAEKQQVAVLADRFLQRKAEIAQKVDAVKAQVRVVLNGDVVFFVNKPVVEDGKVLVPAGFFNKMGAEASFNGVEGTISRTLADGSSKEVRFSQDGSNAAKVINNEVYVPVISVAEALGAEAAWNININTVTINDAETVQYPGLFSAIESNRNYKGEFSSKGTMQIEDSIFDGAIKMVFGMDGAINGEDFHSSYTTTTSMTGLPDIADKFEIIKIGEKVYVKVPDYDEWVETTLEDLQASGLYMGTGLEASAALSEEEYTLYSINRTGYEFVNGEVAAKYEITPDISALERMLQEQDPAADLESMPLDSANIKIVVFVNRQNQIVKEVVGFDMSIEENGESMGSVKASFDINFRNIGAEVEIKAPEAVSDLTLDELLYGFDPGV